MPGYARPAIRRTFARAARSGSTSTDSWSATLPPSANDFNLWELRLPNGLAPGDHVLTVTFVPYNPSTGGGGTPINGLVPVTIHVDAAPVHGGTDHAHAESGA